MIDLIWLTDDRCARLSRIFRDRTAFPALMTVGSSAASFS